MFFVIIFPSLVYKAQTERDGWEWSNSHPEGISPMA
jgi:hypothetical protein